MTAKDENGLVKRRRIDSPPCDHECIPLVVSEPHDLFKVSKAAEGGNADAQYKMGLLHSYGHYLQKNDYDAVVYYVKAAQQGHLAALYNCCEFFMTGNAGLPCRPHYAIQWFRYAAERGHAASQRKLGLIYFDNQHWPVNFKKGIEWLQRAANQGDEIARVWLCIYRPDDYVMDQVASSLITPEGFYAMGEIHSMYLSWVERKYYPKAYKQFLDLHFDEKKAETWFVKAANLGHSQAMRRLFQHHQHGIIGLDWLTRGVEKGDPSSQNLLGRFYHKGEFGLKKDTMSSVLWYGRAAHQGYRQATLAMARFYDTGTGVIMNRHEAHNLYSMAVYQGDYRAMRHLSHLYRLGSGCEQDQAKSIHWLLRAACGGDIKAQRQIRHMNPQLRGALHDIKKSCEWISEG